MSNDLVQVELGGGKKSAPVTLDKSIVRIGSKFYYKDSDIVVLVRTTPRTRKYFRKVSPLIKNIGGKYYLKKSIRQFEDGQSYSIFAPEVVRCEDGEYRLRTHAVEHNGKWYDPKAKSTVTCMLSGNNLHEQDAIQIQRMVPDGSYVPTWVSKEYEDEIMSFGDENFLRRDCNWGYNALTDEFDFIPRKHSKWISKGRIFGTFNTVWSGDLSRCQYTETYAGCTEDEFTDKFAALTSISLPHASNKLNVSGAVGSTPLYVKRDDLDLFKNAVLYHYDSNNGGLTPENFAIYAKVLGINEDFDVQQASFEFQNYGAGDIMTNHKQRQLGDTPDPEFCELGYSVGIEIESSGGALKNKECRDIGLGKVGDRSVGACEYITPALSNDEVGKYIDQLEKLMQGKLMLDKRCATHVHIGALRLPKLTKIMQSTRFARLALRLGAHLEDEWFAMMPKYRSPKRYHCYSIKGYSKINSKNEDAMLGAYLYGGHESGLTHQQRIGSFSYRRGGSGGRWSGGRYKWLNISNLLNGGGITTIEFRLFPATYNAAELRFHTLLSMLFVEFIVRYPDEVESKLYAVDWEYIVKKLVKNAKLRMNTIAKIKQFKKLNNQK